MKLKNGFCLVAFLLLVSSTSSLVLQKSQASESQGIEFSIILFGDFSGYQNEAYIAVRTETEWTDVWQKHMAPFLPESPCPEINFAEKIVVCAFMGMRPTTGYKISVEKMWTDGEKIHVEITKRGPLEGLAVSQVLTQPYVFVSIDKVDEEIILHVTDENGGVTQYTLPEFPAIPFVLITFVVLSAATIALKRKGKRD
ncbi:protease complex subunit PrcB family protein [Candidatus Bathyarchaeota archaeon]|nr:protease complex subunit PrcB family protein [Candidatus Bathyarchaeota archaeon]